MADIEDPDRTRRPAPEGDVWDRLRALDDHVGSTVTWGEHPDSSTGPEVPRRGGVRARPDATGTAGSHDPRLPAGRVPRPADRERLRRGATVAQPAPPPAGSGGAGAPSPTPTARDARTPRWRRWVRPKLRWVFLYLPLLVIALIAGVTVWAWRTVEGLQRVDLAGAERPAVGGAVNYLLVGTDTRAGITDDTPNLGAIGTSSEVSGTRTDTLIVLRVGPDGATMMSIPRDLWVTNVATGRHGRINAAYAAGPANLVKTLTANLGIPVQHYVEVSFVSFASMVDALGGIDVHFEHAAMDPNSGLRIPNPGTHHLDGSSALAYVRSRHYYESIDGRPVLDPTADLGRQQRQQTFIRQVIDKVGSTRNPLTLVRVAGAARKGVKVDEALGFGDFFSLVRRLSGSMPTSVVLPTRNARRGGADVLDLDNAKALSVLARFGAGSA
ncbi:MAG: LCP family protein [Microthrixaceae bacterium]